MVSRSGLPSLHVGEDVAHLPVTQRVLVVLCLDQLVQGGLHPTDVRHVGEHRLAALAGRLDGQRAAAEQPLEEVLVHRVVVDPGEWEVPPVPGEDTLLEQHSLVGEQVVGGPPDQERPQTEPEHRDQGDHPDHGDRDRTAAALGQQEHADHHRGDGQHQHHDRPDQCLPVRMQVQHDVLVLGEHVFWKRHGNLQRLLLDAQTVNPPGPTTTSATRPHPALPDHARRAVALRLSPVAGGRRPQDRERVDQRRWRTSPAARVRVAVGVAT